MAIPIQLISPSVGISCHAWNADCSKLAVCPNTNELYIYENCLSHHSEWERTFVLSEHDLLISAVDWCPITNRIVTCSHDRNAFVWTFDEGEGEWKPSLVVLRIDRSALCVKWSPNGTKFAIGSGSKNVAICYFEQSENWWISKIIKKHKSSVISVAWHPNSQIVATGSTDMRCRIISCFIPEIEDQQIQVFGDILPFGGVYHDFQTQSWIHDVNWSPSGNSIVYAGHNSSLHFVSLVASESYEQVLRVEYLPFIQVSFLSENACVCAGHDSCPMLFTCDSQGKWSFSKKIDSEESKVEETKISAVAAARSKFQNQAKTGQANATQIKVQTVHISPISCLSRRAMNNGLCSSFSTSAADGKIVIWNLETLSIDLNALQI